MEANSKAASTRWRSWRTASGWRQSLTQMIGTSLAIIMKLPSLAFATTKLLVFVAWWAISSVMVAPFWLMTWALGKPSKRLACGMLCLALSLCLWWLLLR